jgi:polyferredoxin
LTKLRKISQVLGILVFILLFAKLTTIYIFILFFVLTLLFGRVFCGWLCPIGLLEELIGKWTYTRRGLPLRAGCNIGCPFIWVTAWLNRVSLFKIEINKDKCVKCGICDKVCPTRLIWQTEGWKEGRNSADRYGCIRCGTCIANCPEQALSYTLRWKRGKR